MTTIPDDHNTEPETEVAAPVASEADAAPLKKRGTFLPSRFFGGRDKEVTPSEAKQTEAGVSPASPAPTLIPLTTPAGMSSIGSAQESSPQPVIIPGEPSVPAHDGLFTAVGTPPEPSKALASKLAVSAVSLRQPTVPTSPFVSDPQLAALPIANATNTTDRAYAQLTFGFEITSLQLTPFFKLGSVQLKALSNVILLHLMTARASANPLATGISFQIDRVELEGASRIRSILLKPLDELHAMALPLSRLQVDHVALSASAGDAPISVTTSDQASTAVQVFGTFTITALNFTPSFGIETLRLEPTTNTVLLRVSPSIRPTALDLPPAFEIAEVQLDDGARIGGMRVATSTAKNM